MERTIAGLPRALQRLWQVHYVEDRTLAAYAAEQGISDATAERHHKKLRDAVEEALFGKGIDGVPDVEYPRSPRDDGVRLSGLRVQRLRRCGRPRRADHDGWAHGDEHDGGGQTTTAGTTTGGQVTTTGTGGSPPACPIDHLLISQVRSRGLAGASDEFVELFNPTGQDVLLDSSWSLQGRKADATVLSYTTRWTGSTQTIPARGHFLIVGSGYTQQPMPDDHLSDGITDAASLVLQNSNGTVDALCYYDDTLSEGVLGAYPLHLRRQPNPGPHDDTATTDIDVSLDRNKAHGVPQCEDTDDNDTDFAPLAPSTPKSSMSPPAP